METVIQIVKNIPTNFLAGLVFNGRLIALSYFLFWKKFKERYRLFRIQLQERFNDAQLKHELKNSITTLTIAAIYSSITIYLGTQGYTKVYIDFSSQSPF